LVGDGDAMGVAGHVPQDWLWAGERLLGVTFRSVDSYVRERVRGFLARRTRWQGAVPVGSRSMRSIGTAKCCA
jgi:hypothetical protein